ncbi:MAG TPA: transcription elongation factor GreA [Candidatus Saccharimonadales bacterium]|nr:transcription elongation factor GreA [Candidatus Saccharimonadales bacterium]
MVKKIYNLTQEGVDELKNEHAALVAQRPQVADRIKYARELGDLSENAEYQTAREEQDRLESRISELEHILQSVKIIKKPKNDGHVRLGSSVELKDGGKPLHYQVVGTMEADPAAGKISDESPIGKALLGKKVGDKVEITTPAGSHTYTVKEIS